MCGTGMSKNSVKLKPGSPEAVAMGCACPVLDNGHGKGWLGDGKQFGWVVNEDCPLHGQEHKREFE